jgi:hypothetical protein
MKFIFLRLGILAVLLQGPILVHSQSALEIVKASEEKYRGVLSAYTEMELKVIRPKWTRELSMKSWSKGNDYSLVLITYPAKEKGTAFLKKNKDAWNWVPAIERTIKLSPSMMMQSWMGSDFTNDDFVKESSLVRDYDHKLIGEQMVDDILCYIIELMPKPDAAVVWSRVILYIDKKELIQMKSEMFDEDDDMVKTMIASDIQTMDKRRLATTLTLVPLDKNGYKTQMKILKIEFDRPIQESFFTTQNMKSIQ